MAFKKLGANKKNTKNLTSTIWHDNTTSFARPKTTDHSRVADWSVKWQIRDSADRSWSSTLVSPHPLLGFDGLKRKPSKVKASKGHVMSHDDFLNDLLLKGGEGGLKNWLVGWTNPVEKYARQNGFNLPQVVVKIKNSSSHQPEKYVYTPIEVLGRQIVYEPSIFLIVRFTSRVYVFFFNLK